MQMWTSIFKTGSYVQKRRVGDLMEPEYEVYINRQGELVFEEITE